MKESKEPKGFQKAKKRAEELLKNTPEVTDLLNKTVKKLKFTNNQKLNKLKNEIITLVRMVNAWVNGRYRSVPWNTILFACAALVYFVNPFDLIFDAIPFFGLVDDITVIGFVVNAIQKDIEKFRVWENEQDGSD
ncbi:MAG: DUF1232 domain-containing protein [Chitinophagales bacterium]|nr:DUF1232 domain-containing protein [Chitinophagales bacterium]